MSDNHQGGWAFVGKLGLVVGILVGLHQLYTRVIAKEVYVEGQGMCRQFTVPDTYLKELKGDTFPTYEEIEKLLPEKLPEKRLIAIDLEKSNLDRRNKLRAVGGNLADIRSLCSFTISNTGDKEAQDINLELPRQGIYLIDKLGEPSKEADFKKIISVGKLNPGGRIKITTWNKDLSSDVNSWERADFRLTHTLGISEVDFLPENTTWIGWMYETYPTFSFMLFVGVLILASWAGVSLGRANEQLKAQQAKKLEDDKKQIEQKETEPVTDVEPPSPT